MKTDNDLRHYLTQASGEIVEAFRLACKDHHPMDQTLDMKKTRMQQLVKEGV